MTTLIPFSIGAKYHNWLGVRGGPSDKRPLCWGQKRSANQPQQPHAAEAVLHCVIAAPNPATPINISRAHLQHR